MQDLIQQLKDKAGLTEDQAHKSLQVMKEFIHSKVPPMFSGVVDSFLGNMPDAPATSGSAAEPDFMETADKVTKETTDKIEILAEEAKEGVEQFAREASERIDVWAIKAEEAAKEAVEKLKGIMEEKKETAK